MFKLFLVSLVILPVALGMHAGTLRPERSGLSRLLALLFGYNALYLLILYYLRYRWIS